MGSPTLTDSDGTPAEERDAFEHRNLVVTLEITYPPDCILSEVAGETVGNVTSNLVNDTCLCELEIEHEDGSTEYCQESSDVDQECICQVFVSNEHLPKIQSVDSDVMVVRTRLQDRKRLRELVRRLKAVADRVRVIQVIRADGSDDGQGQTVLFDLSTLTKKQRNTLDYAVSRGYYDDPKRINLEALAEKLDISKSTLSYRLKTAEKHLVNSLLETV